MKAARTARITIISIVLVSALAAGSAARCWQEAPGDSCSNVSNQGKNCGMSEICNIHIITHGACPNTVFACSGYTTSTATSQA